MKIRILNDDVLQRVRNAEAIIFNWMKIKGKDVTEPEECFEELVKAGIYEYDSKHKAHHFREDLRNLRENNRLDIFTRISVTQDSPGRPWVIRIQN